MRHRSRAGIHQPFAAPLPLGYADAARIMDQMEQEKIIGPYEGAKPRAVLLTRAQWQERQLGQGE